MSLRFPDWEHNEDRISQNRAGISGNGISCLKTARPALAGRRPASGNGCRSCRAFYETIRQVIPELAKLRATHLDLAPQLKNCHLLSIDIYTRRMLAWGRRE